MTYSDARYETEAELHTIAALLLVLEDLALTHLTNDQQPIVSGIINLIQVIGDRAKRAQELHDAESDCQRKEVQQ